MVLFKLRCVLLLIAVLFGINSSITNSVEAPALKAISSDNGLEAKAVTNHYVTLAHRRYEDSLSASVELLKKINEFLANPSKETHNNAKHAWLNAHQVYSHTEVFRFGNPNVDAWEAKVNAWPMDEGLIDYVSSEYVFHEGNPHARENLIGTSRIPLTDEVIQEYQSGMNPKAAPDDSFTDLESNVTTGFHAIEFLLWGQDLNESMGECGKRSYTDYLTDDRGTNGNCQRRRQYLSAAARLLVADMRYMVRDWDRSGSLYAKTFMSLSTEEQLDRILVGIGSLCYAELAIERMRVALITNDQEEEQSCFSDLTHHAIWHNAKTIETTYFGTHKNQTGEAIEGPSLSDLVKQLDKGLDQQIHESFAKTEQLADQLVESAEAGMPFDQLILPDNEAGREQVQALINQLKHQALLLEKVRALKNRLAQL